VPTSFTPLGVIDTRASTNRFVAGPLPPGPLPIVAVAGSVSRVTVALLGVPVPVKPQTAVALAVNVAALLLLMEKVQVRVSGCPAGVVGLPHVLPRIVVDGDTLGVSDVSDAVVPEGDAVVVTVNVWAVPTSFTPLGVIETFASTNRLTAGPELPAWPFVETLNVPPPNDTVAEALPVMTSAVEDVKITVHLPSAPVPVVAQLFVVGVSVVLLALVRVTVGLTPWIPVSPPETPAFTSTVNV
jgi:hypothetical protein